MIIIIVLIGVVNIVCSIYHYLGRIGEIITVIRDVSIILIILTIVVCIVSRVIYSIKQGIWNITDCKDDLFRKIDQHKRNLRGDKAYIKLIQIINLYYEEGGKVDELVKNNEIERLFARADFLLHQKSLSDDFKTYYISFGLSVFALFFTGIAECENVVVTFVWMVVIIFSFLALFISKYTTNDQVEVCRAYIDEYERKLLLRKIKKLEQKLIIADDDEPFLEMKQIVINELIRIKKNRRGKKQKNKLEDDIRMVGQLDLCIDDYGKCHIEKIHINGMTGYLVYDQEKGKENNYKGEVNLINQDYSILYQILNKHDLIQPIVVTPEKASICHNNGE